MHLCTYAHVHLCTYTYALGLEPHLLTGWLTGLLADSLTYLLTDYYMIATY